MTGTVTEMRDRHYAVAMHQFGETEAAVAADPHHRAQVRMDDGTIIDVERDPVLGIYLPVERLADGA